MDVLAKNLKEKVTLLTHADVMNLLCEDLQESVTKEFLKMKDAPRMNTEEEKEKRKYLQCEQMYKKLCEEREKFKIREEMMKRVLEESKKIKKEVDKLS